MQAVLTDRNDARRAVEMTHQIVERRRDQLASPMTLHARVVRYGTALDKAFEKTIASVGAGPAAMARVLEMHGMLAALGSKSGGDIVAEFGAFLASRLTASGHNEALEVASEEVLAASLERESDTSPEVEIVDEEGALTKFQGAPHSSALGARVYRLQPGESPGVHAVSEPTDVTATAPETSAATNHNRVVEAIPATRAYWCPRPHLLENANA